MRPAGKIGVASDHGGLALKNQVAAGLRAAGCKVVDFGPARLNARDDYPDYVVPLARAVARGEVRRGIAICGSGVGACVAANKVRGVRAAVCHDTYSAHQGVEHDDMNVLVLGARVIGTELAHELVAAFLHATFSGGSRHVRRLRKVAALEGAPAGAKTPARGAHHGRD